MNKIPFNSEEKDKILKIKELLGDEYSQEEKEKLSNLIFAKKSDLLGVLSGNVEKPIKDDNSITETEEKLQETYAILENLPYFATFTIDKGGNVNYVSPTMYNISGDTNHKLFNSNIFLLPSYKDCGVLDKVEKAFKTGDTQYINNIEFTSFYGKKTTIRNFIIVPYFKGEEQKVIIFIEDITEKSALEERLRRAQKLESIGKFAGWTAHHFNNILTVISGQVQLKKMYGDNIELNIDSIIKSCNQGAKLTEDLLSFSRNEELYLSKIKINEFLRNTFEIAKRQYTEKNIKFDLDLENNSLNCMIDATQFSRVLFHIIQNSIDVINGEGTITIGLKSVNVDYNLGQRLKLKNIGKYINISVSDTGYGISKENLPNIFDPFFTTKELGKGTGLGLSMAYGIIKKHLGGVDINSKEGEGTTFNIYIPVVD